MISQKEPGTVLERKIRLDGTTEDFRCEPLALEPGRRAVLRYLLDRDWHVADVLVVPRGAVTVSHYWTDRPYNVYHWLVDGRTLACYCNVVAATTIAPDLVTYEDLTVDVLIAPDGTATVLDEDELPPDLDPRHRRTIAQALEAIMSSPRRLLREIEEASAMAERREAG